MGKVEEEVMESRGLGDRIQVRRSVGKSRQYSPSSVKISAVL